MKPTEEAPEEAPAPDPAPPGAPPPAAELVINNPHVRETDAAEMVRLKREADDAKRQLKEREVEIAHVRDENQRLKTPPAPKAERAPGWMDMYRSPSADASEA